MKLIKNTLKDMDKILLVITTLLFIFGLFNIVTASSRAAVIRYNTSLYSYFFKQLISIIAGLIVTTFILGIPTKKYGYAGAIFYVIVLALLLYVYLFVDEQQGSKNWIVIKGFGTLQPSEFAKPAMIIMVSFMFEKMYKTLRNPNINHYDSIAKILFVGCLYPAIIFLCKDLGTMIVITTIFGVLFITSPILKNEKIKMIGVVIFVGILILLFKGSSIFTPAQLSRFDFFDPCSDYYEGGYQICNGFIAINEGGLFGNGIGESKQVSYIPESHTDSVFAIIAEEYGLIICTLIFIAYLVILFRIFKLSSRTSTIKGKYICLGIGVYIFLHFLINLGGLFGIMPLTGVPLPFLSYGGSYTLSLMISLAVVQSIHIETEREKIRV
mgnify:FL=1